MRDAASSFYLIEIDFGTSYGAAFYEARVETGGEVKRLIVSGEIEKRLYFALFDEGGLLF